MTMGARIKAKRQELKMSQREFATKLGYTDHTTITRIESDKIDLPLSRVIKIAKVLNIEPIYLTGWDENSDKIDTIFTSVSSDPQLLELITDFIKLDEIDRLAVSTLVSSLAFKNKSHTS